MTDIKAPWAVCLKESNNDQSVEYSVVRIDFDHGFRSYGWEEPDRKQIVAGSGGPCNYQYTPLLKGHLKHVAIEYATELNRLEGQGDFNVMWYEDNKPPIIPGFNDRPLTEEQNKLLEEKFNELTRLLTRSQPN